MKRKIFKSELTSDEMIDFILESNLRDWSGEIGYNEAKDIARYANKWELVELPLNVLGNWIADSSYKNKSKDFPPIVSFDEDEYEIFDGKHRIGMANDRGEKTIQVYLGKL
jgi:hypothetical protein